MPQDAGTYKYTPKEQTREYNTFTEEYFSGSDVTLYLDGEQVTQVSNLNYSLQEQLKPIFGYASRTFDDIAIGNRIVIGSFRIPISNPENNSNLFNLGESSTDDSNGSYVENNDSENYDKYDGRPDWAVNSTLYQNKILQNIRTQISENGNVYYNGIDSNKDKNDLVESGGIYYDMSYKNPLQYNEDLKTVQKELLSLNYSIDINGFYDNKTRLAVIKYQKDNNLNESGILDTETRYSILYYEGDNSISKTAVTIIPNVSLRNGPGNEFRAIDELPNGTNVLILSVTEDWYFVKLDNNKKGYIAKSLLKVVE